MFLGQAPSRFLSESLGLDVSQNVHSLQTQMQLLRDTTVL